MMIDKVRQTMANYKMIEKGDKILVALSGGPDSLCLFHILFELKREFGFKLYLAHFNHGIRRESAGDVNYVRRLSKKFKVSLRLARKDIPKMAKEEGGSIEMIARKARYQFLIDTARELRANKIALGHNQDDQVETFLLNFLRGSGTAGLSGMPAKRKLARLKGGKNIYIIRPLIGAAREEIIAYLDKKKLRARLDASNLSLAFKRNKIRWQLLPLLQKEYNPNIKGVIKRITEIFKEEDIFWQEYLKTIFKNSILKKSKKEIQLNLKKVSAQAEAVQSRILQRALRQLLGDLRGINYAHITAIKKLCRRATGRKFLTLPGNVQVVKNYDKLILEKGKITRDYPFKFPIKAPGGNFFPVLAAKLEIGFKSCNKNVLKRHIEKLRFMPFGKKFEAILDKDRLKFPLFIRNRFPGDRFQPLGLTTFPKLKKYFINKKISLLERGKNPLLVDSRGRIAWVIGLEIADWAKVTAKTRKISKMKYNPSPPVR